jgi:signal transduction histidine kinase
MHALATTEAINRDHRFLKVVADGGEPLLAPGRKGRPEVAHAARVRGLDLLTVSIAHEVNQPLAAIVMNGETCLRGLDRAALDVERVRELTRRMIRDARRASEIVDRVRTMAKRQAPRYTPLLFNEIIEESVAFLRHEFQSRNISVSLDLDPELPRVVGDRTQLQQVIVNLLVNAAQAMTDQASPRGGIRVRTMLSEPGTVCCSIEDGGPGIKPAHLSHLFDDFFTTKASGMGMGLPISQSIIEAHGGWIEADNGSSLGGARFSFTLPAEAAGR